MTKYRKASNAKNVSPVAPQELAETEEAGRQIARKGWQKKMGCTSEKKKETRSAVHLQAQLREAKRRSLYPDDEPLGDGSSRGSQGPGGQRETAVLAVRHKLGL